MDDAFAGGVCRCQHCGTIQTVPGKSKLTTTPSEQIPTARPASDRQPAAPFPPAGSGLDELAQIVASSGLRSSRLRQAPASKSARKTTVQAQVPIDPDLAVRNRLLMLIAIAMLAGVAVLIFILFILLRGKPASPTRSAPPTATMLLWISPQTSVSQNTWSDNRIAQSEVCPISMSISPDMGSAPL